MERRVLRRTHSVCPVCLRPVSAKLVQCADNVVSLEKECPQHGSFSTPVWRQQLDLSAWCDPLPEADEGPVCPDGCSGGICAGHQQGTCCALLEVTRRCSLHCTFCFADQPAPEPSFEELKEAIRNIFRLGNAPLLQFSGGEPTLRDDLPELVAYAHSLGFPFLQLNTNGLRLAEDPDYVRALAEAGLSFVFLQFDGVTDDVFRALRGQPLLQKKLQAISVCDRFDLGVTLVPTVVRGINDHQIGDIIRLGASMSPAVRGVHFQPVSYFGRIPGVPDAAARYTLDELASAVASQTQLPPESLSPSRCDHPMCGFHGTFLAEDGALRPLRTQQEGSCCGKTTARQNREYVGRHWKRSEPACCSCESDSLDGFLQHVRQHSFTLTAMAFQDAMNLDAQRLRRCSLHVYDNGVLKPFCARYLTPFPEER